MVVSEHILASIRARADERDQSGDWPAEELDALNAAGILGQSIPVTSGGTGASPLDQHLAYESIATASLAVALIVSQRDSAAGLIEGATTPIAHDVLGRLAVHKAIATVGIAQLTTSRQGGAPALRAVRTAGGYTVDGIIPWATGAARADWLVAGAATDGRQRLLFRLPRDAAGLMIDPPMALVALRATWTTSLHCQGVHVPDELVLRGPADQVLGRRNSLPLGQVFLATGLCRAALNLTQAHGSSNGAQAWARLDERLRQVRGRVLALSQPGLEPQATAAAPELRGECNDLAVRCAHAAVALYKGTALLAGHPAQRLAREAMFLLVWSCPGAVIDCTLQWLSAC